MYLPPALWAWIRAPATHFLGARILITSAASTPPAALSALPQHLPPPFSVIVLSSQYLFQRGPIWVSCDCSVRLPPHCISRPRYPFLCYVTVGSRLVVHVIVPPSTLYHMTLRWRVWFISEYRVILICLHMLKPDTLNCF